MLATLRDYFETLWSWIQSIFSPIVEPDNRDLEVILEPVDVDSLREEFGLVEAAERYGSRNLPRADDRGLDAPQQRVHQHMEERLAKAFRHANDKLNRLEDAIRARDIAPLVRRAESLPKRTRSRVKQDIRRASTRLESLRSESERIQKELQNYKERHGIERGPNLRESAERRNLITITLMLALLQMVANGAFFAQGMRLGFSMGLLFAVLLGAIDVLLHTYTGFQSAKIQAGDITNRIVGGIFLGLTAVTIATWNLGLVHLRLGISEFGTQAGFEEWLPRLINNPLGFTDFISVALLLVGIMCSSLAATTGWNWDEPIPELRTKGRKLDELNAEIQHEEDIRHAASEEGYQQGMGEFEELIGRVQQNINMMRANFNQVQHVRENLMVFTHKMKHAYKTLIRFYRDENMVHREEEPPDYFRNEPEIDFEPPLDLDESALRAFVTDQEALKEEFEDKTEELRDQLEGIAELSGIES